MRRFEVFAGCSHREMDTHIVEMPDTATDEECEEACREILDTLIGNNFDTGWNELEKKAEVLGE